MRRGDLCSIREAVEFSNMLNETPFIIDRKDEPIQMAELSTEQIIRAFDSSTLRFQGVTSENIPLFYLQ